MNDFDKERMYYNKKCIQILEEHLDKFPMLRIEQIIYNLDNGKDYFNEEPWDTFERWSNK